MCVQRLCVAPPARVTLSRGDFWQTERFYYFLLKIKGILLGLVGKEVNRAFPISCLCDSFRSNVCHKMDFCPNWLQPKITSPHFCQFGQLFTCAVCVASSPDLNLCEDEALRCSPSKCAGDGVFLHWVTRLSLLLSPMLPSLHSLTFLSPCGQQYRALRSRSYTGCQAFPGHS